MISDSLTYPIEGENTAEILIIGGILSLLSGLLIGAISFLGALTLGIGFVLLPIAFIPTLGIVGYYVRILKSTVEGQDEPPAFDDLGMAFKDGLFATAIGFVYYLIPIILISITTVFGGFLGGSLGSDTGGMLGGTIIFVGFGLATILTIALTYIYPAALTRYAVLDNVGAAFSFSELSDTILGMDYLVAWLFGFIILSVGFFIAGAISLIPFIGWIIGPVIQFLFAMMAYRAFGLAYNAGTSSNQPSSETAAA